MKRLMTLAILSVLGATSAGAAVVVFDPANRAGPLTVEDAAAQAAGANGVSTFFGKTAVQPPRTNGPTLANAVGGGSIGMWIKPPQNGAVAPATQGGGQSLARDEPDETLGVVSLPGALMMMIAALGILALGAGVGRRPLAS